jgi:hypothetical protein
MVRASSTTSLRFISGRRALRLIASLGLVVVFLAWGSIPAGADDPPPEIDDPLFGVAAVSSQDVWAVGSAHGCDPIALHWEGAGWSQVPTPKPADTCAGPTGILALSASDIWAVGGAAPIFEAGIQPYYLHWDGEAWSIVPSPPVPAYSWVEDVSAVSPTDIWAVGAQRAQDAPAHETLIEHWDGNEWTVVPSPNVPEGDWTLLEDVAAVSSNDVWAVGRWITLSPTIVSHSAILHWDGSAWSIVAHPGTGALWGVVSISSDDVWAGGEGGKLHWDGEEWSLFPNVGPSTTEELAAISSRDVWAVGSRSNATGLKALAEHWDGTSWKRVKLPTLGSQPPAPEGDASALIGVSAVSSRDVWAVGYFGPAFNPNTLTLHWNGKRWKHIPSPSP